MKNDIKYFIEKIAKGYKGPDYHIDPTIPVNALIGYGFRRICGLLRCLMHGVKLSLNPYDLVFIEHGVELRNKRMISFGRGVYLGKNVLIDGLSKEGIKIGNDVNIGAFTIVEATGVISNVGKGVVIGDHSSIGAFSIIGAAGGVRIGSNVIMGKRVSFHSENHKFDRLDIPIRKQGVTRKGIVIEDDCWIGANVTLLDGAHIGMGCVVAAGSIVRDIFPSYSVIAGVPARIVKSRINDKISK